MRVASLTSSLLGTGRSYRYDELSLKPLVEDGQVVEPAPLVAFRASKNSDLNARVLADPAGAGSPGAVLEEFSICVCAILSAVVELFVGTQGFERRLHCAGVGVV